MPYRVSRRGKKWTVEKKDGGKVLGEHDSASKAYAQLRALYASEGKKP